MRTLVGAMLAVMLAACTPDAPVTQAVPTPVAPVQVAGFEATVTDGINAERAKRGLPTLAPATALAAAGAVHLRDLSATGGFDHTGSDGSTPADRVARQGLKSCLTAENLFRGPMPPQGVVDAWMTSQGHRDNILRRGVTHIGVARSGDLVIAVFAKPC